ncbi:transcriptional regulator, Sir2 family [Necator americanus]|uniref:NAD-dependent protein deacetylase n=1 Tax=Necator americanus TaxID=51031 RepID=W2T0E9_NECAM|nr:transcriptional regulator, Sir2 family [Necator americanus]ETN75039.1 transcriptional regulator, Sir2 family [Necator americanus]
MSDEDSARNRKTGTSREDDNEGKSDESKAPPKQDLYSRFVESFENALNTVSSTVNSAVKAGAEGHCGSKSKLKTFSLEGIADFIKTERPNNIIVMTGAGISTSAGIPDFRSPGTGLYDNLQKYNLPDPQAVFDISFFHENPEPFFALSKELFPETLKPTPCHYFIKLLNKKGILRRWFTQNIDSLEFLTGVPEDKIVTAHGSHRTSTCLRCHKKYDLQWLTEHLKDKECLVPKCDKCEGVVKPDITFFGENLPKRFFQCAISDFPKCDLLLIMGTSLVVQPFASMVNEVSEEVPRLLINKEEAGRASGFERAVGIQGLCYGLKDNKRDVFWRGSCDDGCRKLAELLDWEHELDALIQEGELKNKV